MIIIKRGLDSAEWVWPFGYEITCGNCQTVYELEPGKDARSFDVQAVTKPSPIMGLSLPDAPHTVTVAAITTCPQCGYPCALYRDVMAPPPPAVQPPLFPAPQASAMRWVPDTDERG